MSLLTTTFVFITIGCVYSQDMQFGQFGHDFDEQLAQMGKNIDRNLKFGQLGQDMDSEISQFGKDINKNFHIDQAGQDIDKQVNRMGENLGKHMDNLGNQMSNQFGNMGNQFERMGNQFEKLGNNFEKQFSNMQFGSGINQESHQALQIENAIKASVDKMLYHAKGQCVSAGHRETAALLENMFADASQCIKGKVDVKSLENDFSEAMKTEDVRSFSKKSCALWTSSYHCVKPVIVTYEKCLSPKEVEIIEKFLDLVDSSSDFFCENDANRISKFIEKGGFECYTSNQNNLQSCVNTAVQKIQNEDNSAMVTYDEVVCNILGKSRRCLVQSLSSCSSNTPSEIFDDYLGLVSRKVCNTASSIAWFSFVNIILLLFTYLYSKMF